MAYFFFLAGWFATLLLAVAWQQNVHRLHWDGLEVRPTEISGGEVRLSGRALALGRVGLLAGILLVGHWPGAVYDLALVAPSFDRQLRPLRNDLCRSTLRRAHRGRRATVGPAGVTLL